MNFLAHAFLSFQHPALIRGNLLGDFVKGEQRMAFSDEERVGMDLHRFIDTFTDNHPSFQKARILMRPAGIMGAGVFVDIIFDHMLAKHSNYFNNDTLIAFAQQVYADLPLAHPATPPRAVEFFQAMVKYDWLYHYRHIAGTERSLQGMCRRYPRLGRAEEVLQGFHTHYNALEMHFDALFPELALACNDFLRQHPQFNYA